MWVRIPLPVQINKVMTIKDVMNIESNDDNFTVDFKTLTAKFGKDYIAFCQAMWAANDGVQTEEKFMKMNGDMPRTFFENVVKKGASKMKIEVVNIG